LDIFLFYILENDDILQRGFYLSYNSYNKNYIKMVHAGKKFIFLYFSHVEAGAGVERAIWRAR